jgi:hypothetical protein
MNIIEQEDIVKGLPDAALQMEMQMPSGQIPEFLVLSEIQRRTDMRQRYAAQEPMPTATVKDQVMAQGLAAAAAPLSPVPAGPGSSLPALPVGDAQQGLAGMGVPMMAKGGKTESDFPDYSGDGEITKKDILIGRGVIPMQEGGQYLKSLRNGEAIVIRRGEDPKNYTTAELVEIGRSGPNELGVMSNFMSEDHPAFSFGSYQADPEVRARTDRETEQERLDQRARDFRANMPTTEEMVARYKAAEEMEAPLGGVGAEERRGRIGTALQDIETMLADPDRLPYTNMPYRNKQFLDPVAEAALSTREGIIGGVDTAKILGETGLDAALDFITVAGSGDPTDPEAQRQRAAEDVASSASDFFSRENLGLRSGQALNLFEDYIYDPASNLLSYVSEEGGKLLADPDTMESFKGGIDQVTEFLKSEGPDGEPSILDRASDFIGLTDYLENQETPAQQTDLGRAEANLADGSGGGGGGGGGSAGSERVTDQFLPAALLGGDRASQSPFMDEAYSSLDELRTSQADAQTNLQDLITQTQQDAKNRALYAGVMGLAQGIAEGDMGKGLERAGDQAGRIMAASETAVAPLRAAQAVAPTENLKAQIDAITDLARADATYQSVSAQFRREEGLDNRKEKDLMIAATRMVDEVFEEGVFDYPDVESAATARAAAVRQIYNELSAMYGDSLIREGSTSTLDTNPETGNLRYSP